jgi:hypothetical protein
MMGDQTKHLRLFWAPGTLGEATHDPQALVGLDQLLGLQTLVKGPEGYQEGVIILVTDSHVDHHTHFRLSPEALGRARRTPGLTTMPRGPPRARARISTSRCLSWDRGQRSAVGDGLVVELLAGSG